MQFLVRCDFGAFECRSMQYRISVARVPERRVLIFSKLDETRRSKESPWFSSIGTAICGGTGKSYLLLITKLYRQGVFHRQLFLSLYLSLVFPVTAVEVLSVFKPPLNVKILVNFWGLSDFWSIPGIWHTRPPCAVDQRLSLGKSCRKFLFGFVTFSSYFYNYNI